MLVFEAKLKGKPEPFHALDNAIRTEPFIRNSCLRYWTDNRGVSKQDIYRFNTQLRNDPQLSWGYQKLTQTGSTLDGSGFRPTNAGSRDGAPEWRTVNKGVRGVRRCNGYYAQFCIKPDRVLDREPTGKAIGLDVGLKYFYILSRVGHTRSSAWEENHFCQLGASLSGKWTQ